MNIPRFVTMGGHRISVRFADDNETTRHGIAGFFDYKVPEIVIGKSAPPSQREETFIHELIECADWLYGLNIPHGQIQDLGIGLHQALTTGEGRLSHGTP